MGAPVRRDHLFHQRLIPLLVEGIGASSYVEFGSNRNETIGSVRCERRYGVDTHPVIMPGIEFFTMTTQQFIAEPAARLAPFDVVFIDAYHSAEAVRADFFGIIDHVAPEGLVLLHDTNPETVVDTHSGLCGDAWKFAEELKREQYEAVTLPLHPGLTIIRNRQSWGPQL